MNWQLRLYRTKPGRVADFAREGRGLDPDPARHIADAEHVDMRDA